MAIQKKYFWATIIINILFYLDLFIVQLVFEGGVSLPSGLGMFTMILGASIWVVFFLGIIFLHFPGLKRHIIYGLLINLFTIVFETYIILSNLRASY